MRSKTKSVFMCLCSPMLVHNHVHEWNKFTFDNDVKKNTGPVDIIL